MGPQVSPDWRPTRTEAEQANSAKLLRNLADAHKTQQARSEKYESRVRGTK